MTRALVIGGSGFVGLNVVDALLAAGLDVRVTRRKKTPTIFLRKRPVELVSASLEEPIALRHAMEGCDYVLLAGAHYPRYSLDREGSIAKGVSGVRAACEAARDVGVARLVYTSSIATLARAPEGRPADERDAASAIPEDSVYRAVKWAMEREVDLAVSRGLPAVTLLPGGCIGPWDLRLGTAGILVAVAHRALPWWTDGTVNIVDVGDVARAHVAALGAKGGSRYCVAGHDVMVRTLLSTVVRRYGGAFPAQPLPPAQARRRADEEERAAAPLHRRVAVPRELVDIACSGQPVSSARAHRELGIPDTPLHDALDRAYAWLERFRYVPPRDKRLEAS